MESAKVGKRGAIIVPARLRKRFGTVEKYTPERKAEFLLSTATTRADYEKARKEARKLGIDPDSVVHQRPA